MHRTFLSTFAEIKDRCEKRQTKIFKFVKTKLIDTFVVVFSDGTQANVTLKTLEAVQVDLPSELFVTH